MKVTLRLHCNRNKRGRNWLLVISNGVTVREFEINTSCTDPNAAKAMSRSLLNDRGYAGIPVRWKELGERRFAAEINTEKKKSPGRKKVSG